MTRDLTELATGERLSAWFEISPYAALLPIAIVLTALSFIILIITIYFRKSVEKTLTLPWLVVTTLTAPILAIVALIIMNPWAYKYIGHYETAGTITEIGSYKDGTADEYEQLATVAVDDGYPMVISKDRLDTFSEGDDITITSPDMLLRGSEAQTIIEIEKHHDINIKTKEE